MTAFYSIEDLRYLMKRLRDPDTGCPWDIKQDFASITSSTIEEAYEVVDAIERGCKEDIKEELGDLLFQIVFYSQMGEEESSFSFDDIVNSLTRKLIRRHPHVFPNGKLTSKQLAIVNEGVVRAQWEVIKAQERLDKGKAGVFEDIPVSLPAVTRALKIQKRAAVSGFDWNNIQGVFLKLNEEIAELQHAIEHGVESELIEEVGDLMFTVINIARKLKVEPEAALRGANDKFSGRFHKMSALALHQGRQMEQMTDLELDKLWNQVKELKK